MIEKVREFLEAKADFLEYCRDKGYNPYAFKNLICSYNLQKALEEYKGNLIELSNKYNLPIQALYKAVKNRHGTRKIRIGGDSLASKAVDLCLIKGCELVRVLNIKGGVANLGGIGRFNMTGNLKMFKDEIALGEFLAKTTELVILEKEKGAIFYQGEEVIWEDFIAEIQNYIYTIVNSDFLGGDNRALGHINKILYQVETDIRFDGTWIKFEHDGLMGFAGRYTVYEYGMVAARYDLFKLMSDEIAWSFDEVYKED